MKYGIIEQIIPSDFIGQNKKVQILSLKKICREAPLVSTKNRLHEFLVDHACALRCSGMVGKSNYGTQIYRTENWLE